MRVLFLLLSVTMLAGCSRGTHAGEQLSANSASQLATQRAVAAEAWFDTLVQRRSAGEPLTPAFVGQLIDAARTRAIAKAEASLEHEDRRAAYARYRDFCAELLRELSGKTDRPDVLAQLRYGISDAEWRMAQTAAD